MTEIYLIRHAEAEGNLFRRLQGQYDANITPLGLRQIRALRARFSGIRIDAVYSSTLHRAQTTAQALYVPKGLTLQTDARFCEIGAGDWEDCAYGDLEQRDAQSVLDFMQRPKLWHTKGSERFESYTERFLCALEEATLSHMGQSIAVVSHGMVLSGVLLRLFFPEQEHADHPENTAVAHLFYENGAYRLDYMSDDSHLPAELTRRGRKSRPYPTGSGNLHFADDAVGRRIAFYGTQEVGAAEYAVSGDEAVLQKLFLKESYRGYGLGAQLCGDVVCRARNAGAKRLRLGSPAGQETGFFARIGFNESGTLNLVPRILEI